MITNTKKSRSISRAAFHFKHAMRYFAAARLVLGAIFFGADFLIATFAGFLSSAAGAGAACTPS